MTRLSKCFHHYVHRVLREDAQFDNVSIIVSDANVPGEGEHKITEFISQQRKPASHECKTRHVIYGGDADLILLALATHEPNFKILREDSQHFTFVQVHVLRESIAREFSVPNFPFQYDLERIVDDWVFLCLLLGNDFLPQLDALNKLDNLLTNLVRFCKKVYISSKVIP
jgi:5'-3' exoribonuclease 2